ncbi:hypothetical protein PILCRDRAFT_80092, partial [Piloderma croceum F 1598]
RCLTQGLLYHDYGITLSLPNERLCPPVPNRSIIPLLCITLNCCDSHRYAFRLNYVLWIQDIICKFSARFSSFLPSSLTFLFLSSGTGASAIYPLLSCRLEPQWHFIATDIDECSINSARLNVNNNDMQHRIDILRVEADGPIFAPLSENSNTSFDFTMCNPPFYSSAEDIAQSAESKEFGPNSASADVEMLTPGGESAFVRRMILESIKFRTRCLWYTSMLGKMSSLFDIVALLRNHSIDNYAITEFVQGQTRRWAVAWSFGDIRLPDVSSQSFVAGSAHSLHISLMAVFQSIDGASYQEVSEDPGFLTSPLLVCAKQNTWSRSVRRKKVSIPVQTSDVGLLETQPPALRCIFGCKMGGTEQQTLVLEVNWVQGRDRPLFESFWSHVCRKLEGRLQDSELGKAMVIEDSERL